ncbi:MAG: hypothetical protein IJ403_06445 [Oscillospiraceae bacterium]|nr:hypothetical protein [Oscillospiraceae bacterium]
MSYRVDYNPEMKNRYPAFVRIKRKVPVRSLLIVVAVITICYGIYRSNLLHYLIPGDPVVTTAAFSGMLDNIEAGETVRQAFLEFCKEIIVNAN